LKLIHYKKYQDSCFKIEMVRELGNVFWLLAQKVVKHKKKK